MIILYVLKSVVVYPITILSTMISALSATILGFFDPYSRLSNASLRFWGRSVIWLAGAKIVVDGLENIDPTQPYVYLANHQSAYDIVALISVIPGTARFVAKIELFKIPLLSMGMRMSGMLPIDRGNSSEARKMLDKAIDTIKAGCSVIIFPEGTRYHTGKVNIFKKGGFMLALKGGIPIAPTVINGTQNIVRGPLKLIYGGTIKISFLPTVPTNILTADDRNTLVWQVHKEMSKKYLA